MAGGARVKLSVYVCVYVSQLVAADLHVSNALDKLSSRQLRPSDSRIGWCGLTPTCAFPDKPCSFASEPSAVAPLNPTLPPLLPPLCCCCPPAPVPPAREGRLRPPRGRDTPPLLPPATPATPAPPCRAPAPLPVAPISRRMFTRNRRCSSRKSRSRAICAPARGDAGARCRGARAPLPPSPSSLLPPNLWL